MSIRVCCGGCGKQYTVKEDWAGKTVRCKSCGAAVRIPQPAAPAEDLLAQELGSDLSNPDPMADLLGDLPAGETPLGASGPALTSVKPKKRTRSSHAPVGDSILAFIRSDVLNTAVAIGMGVVLLSSLVLLVTSGLGGGLIVNGLVFVGGFVIIVGGMRKVRRRRDDVGARAGRVAAWFAGGIMGIVFSIGGAVVAGKSGMPVQSVSILVSPLVAVFAVMTLISGMILAYNVLVYMFPNMNVFRVAGWFYVFLTVVVPILGFMIGIMVESKEERGERIVKELEEWGARAQAEAEAETERIKAQHEAQMQAHEERFRKMQERDGVQPSVSQNQPVFGKAPGTSDRPTTSAFDAMARRLHSRFRSERVATLYLDGVPPKVGHPLYMHILALAGTDQGAWSRAGNPFTMVVAPVDDIQALADRIDFGTVHSVDPETRIIEIKVDAAKAEALRGDL